MILAAALTWPDAIVYMTLMLCVTVVCLGWIWATVRSNSKNDDDNNDAGNSSKRGK